MKELEFKHLHILAKIGKNTSSLLHELNNYFTIISGNLELIDIHSQDIDSKTIERLHKMQNSLEKAIKLVQNTLSEVRTNKIALSSSEFSTIINNCIDLIQSNNLFQNIQIFLNLPLEPFTVFFDPDDFHRILINLLKNAGEAITSQTEKGIIEITTHLSEKYLIMEIANNGPAIPPELYDKLFIPFFTTKPEIGNGLGLSICKEVIEAFDGEIILDKTYHKGTKFIIKLLLQA